MFGKMVIEPGCSIGAHTHDTETEYYYILSGEGVFDDNGKITTVYPGDNTFTGGGEYHALANKTNEALVVLAVIVLD
jgi:mannose-6-phosphate isomerase-like protein (cupin superfamily)